MKNIIIILVLSLPILLLSGCATNTDPQAAGNSVSTTVSSGAGTELGLSIAAINDTMSDSDRDKMVHLVSTATKNQQATWLNSTNPNIQYDFTSLKIFINDKGEPCRDYKVKSSTSGFLYHNEIEAQATACRNVEGNWKLTASHQLT